MALKKRVIDQLVARLGKENVLFSEADRIVYSTDIGSPPGIVDLLVNRKCDAVVRCHSVEDVETAVQFCRKRRIPMTPRAAATNALGGAVPKRAGVVLDMTAMSKNVHIDEAKMRVTADAGVVIADLQAQLNEVGLELPCMPTSALSSTIGGFVAMDGHGLGSTRSGSIGKHVVEIEGVGADGYRFRTRDDEEQSFYIGLGGSTGVLTSITLDVVEASKDKPVLIAAKNWRQVQAIVAEATERFPLKHAMFRSADFFSLRAEATGVKKNPIGDRTAVLLVFAESDHNKHADDLKLLADRLGGEILDDKVAETEWSERFYPIESKRLGPSIVAGEVFVPVEKMRDYLSALRAKTPVKALSIEGHVTDDGRIYFFIYTLDDERRPNYPVAWGTSEWIVKLANDMGGKPYHCGVWLQFHAKKVFGDTRYKKLKAFKKQGDTRNLMNPGMCFALPAPVPEFVHKMAVAGPVPAPSLGLQLWAGGPMLRSAITMLPDAIKHRRKKTVGVVAADVAGDMARGGDMGMHTATIWGADLPSAQAIPNPGNLPMTQTVRGKLVLAKAFVTGKIVDPWTLKDALDVADPSPEDAAVCWEYEHIQPLLDAFRRQVESEGVELEVKAPEIIEEAPAETADAGDSGEPKLDVEAIKKQAAETPEAEKAWVLAADCIVCNGCEAACPTDAAIVTDTARVDRDLCIADGGCFDACPTGAIRPGKEDESQSAGWPEGSRLAGKFGV